MIIIILVNKINIKYKQNTQMNENNSYKKENYVSQHNFP